MSFIPHNSSVSMGARSSMVMEAGFRPWQFGGHVLPRIQLPRYELLELDSPPWSSCLFGMRHFGFDNSFCFDTLGQVIICFWVLSCAVQDLQYLWLLSTRCYLPRQVTIVAVKMSSDILKCSVWEGGLSWLRTIGGL